MLILLVAGWLFVRLLFEVLRWRLCFVFVDFEVCLLLMCLCFVV